uniref:Uncharacterized protein n=1 Tax=Cucumis melo TaxID=3656 RepID=A0A9I9EMR3_CUCME
MRNTRWYLPLTSRDYKDALQGRPSKKNARELTSLSFHDFKTTLQDFENKSFKRRRGLYELIKHQIVG